MLTGKWLRNPGWSEYKQCSKQNANNNRDWVHRVPSTPSRDRKRTPATSTITAGGILWKFSPHSRMYDFACNATTFRPAAAIDDCTFGSLLFSIITNVTVTSWRSRDAFIQRQSLARELNKNVRYLSVLLGSVHIVSDLHSPMTLPLVTHKMLNSPCSAVYVRVIAQCKDFHSFNAHISDKSAVNSAGLVSDIEVHGEPCVTWICWVQVD